MGVRVGTARSRNETFSIVSMFETRQYSSKTRSRIPGIWYVFFSRWIFRVKAHARHAFRKVSNDENVEKTEAIVS